MRQNNYPGIYMASEAIDGAGSTTFKNGLVDRIQREGLPVIGVKEPDYESPIGRLIQDALQHRVQFHGLTLQELFAAGRREHLLQRVYPALEEGTNVVSDRTFLTSVTWAGPEFGYRTLLNFNFDATWPDIVFHLEVEPAVALQRLLETRPSLELFETEEKLVRNAESFNTVLTEIVPSFVRVVRLDATHPPEVMVDRAFDEFLDFRAYAKSSDHKV